MSAQLAQRYLFTLDRFERMVKSGILTPDDKVELIEGEIVKKMPLGPQHAAGFMQSRREDKNGTLMKRIITDFHCLSVSIRTKSVSSVSRLSRGKALTSTLNKPCNMQTKLMK